MRVCVRVCVLMVPQIAVLWKTLNPSGDLHWRTEIALLSYTSKGVVASRQSRAAGVIAHRVPLSREQMAADRTIAQGVMFTRCHNTTHSSCYYTRFTPCKCGRAENDAAPPAAHAGPTAPGPSPTLALSRHNDRAVADTKPLTRRPITGSGSAPERPSHDQDLR